ncbi:MAG TPA: DNA phosphorothioation-associated putative methyltransferase, partial [Thermodesulfobacteriota bacterium]|nr:DNA phosphorothioation-associated putative methyltransferase [Thermodesulfobacteriota bacterium]
MATKSTISRHRTAISRINLSRPIQLALDLGLIRSEWSIFDYGCGKGDDIRGLKALGINTYGWDPTYLPEGKKQLSDLVNLGYVINVIEDIEERLWVLREAWSLTKKALIVSARLVHELKDKNLKSFGDGFVTAKGTFQKYYKQNELRQWIDQELGVSCLAASPGIFIVFRDENLLQVYLASLSRRKFRTPSIRNNELVYENNKELLDALSEFVIERGRIPDGSEFERSDEIRDKFGSIKRAFAIIKQFTSLEQWNTIWDERRRELLINLALQRFNINGRPKFKNLPECTQLDIRAFFSNYKNACLKSDELLFSIGKLDLIDKACRES